MFITFHNTRTICKVTEFLTVADIIDIVTTTRKHSTESIVSVHPSSSSPSSTSDKFRMYRLERSTPGCRIWLQPDKQVWGYGINQGDELIINSRDDQAVAMIATPNCAILHRFEYGMEVNVKEVMEIIKGNDIGFTPPLGIRFGIYHTRFGIWLDESKSLWDYEISKDVN